MGLKKKGFFIWKIKDSEGGNAKTIASVAKASGFTHVLIKIADSTYPNNVDPVTKADYCPPVVSALHAADIQVWGWHYVYGNGIPEAQTAVSRVKHLGLDGYVIDAEVEYQEPGKEVEAGKFMTELRKGLHNLPIALCSFRFPTLHMNFPWKPFLDQCDLNMPQVYWEGAHDNAGAQLQRCVREFQAMAPYRPIVPVGPVYRANGWGATPSEIKEFLDTAKTLNLQAADFFAWDYKIKLKPLWDVITAYNWAAGPLVDTAKMYIDALNTHDAAQVVSLYTPDAVHITASQTIQGTAAIQNWFTTFLTQTLPSASFKLTSSTGDETTRHFTWEASSPKGKIQNGNDTFGLLNGQVTYHYSYFTIGA
ncbi:MAG: nuclear transport factor 2 family protein [Anaerolineaceae bacterium]|jgi:uncharacterized protein (TIGR02246 family)